MPADRNKTGIVFNIQKFSVNDGPGIRTVVFLKGCPLRCRWCANPESQSLRPQVLWDAGKCLSCGHCASVCPEKCVTLEGGRVRIDHAKCTACGICVSGCPARALATEGEKKSVQTVLDIVLQDLPFYEESGGGITLSGGEMLSQPAFSRELLLASKEEGLDTCCETTGMASPAVFDSATEAADRLLFDIKHWDSGMHKSGTGLGNELPLANMARAIASGKAVLPRLPVIPDFNASLDDAKNIARLLTSLGAASCQLLPFHQFGENKYDRLGEDYALRGVKALHREELEEYRLTMVRNGISAFF